LGLSPQGVRSGIAAAAVSVTNEVRPLQLVFASSFASAGATTIFAPQPNPLGNSALQFPLRLQQDETVRLQLTDLTGRILFQSEQMLVAGSHFLVIPATTFPQNGIYIWHIEAGNRVVSGKVVKNK
ncbi:MAG: T9SS type A sorting domain-containing protein, partial [Saprospiraceae bacterium]|nr:T9SS type A sorting domain-containing protein [Saprospiraceae bacterium]